MTLSRITQRAVLMLVIVTSPWVLLSNFPLSAQTGPSGNTPSGQQSSGTQVPQASVGSQTYSIEGDILSYKALQSDGEAIACDAAFALPVGGSSAVNANKSGVMAKPCDPDMDLSSAKVLVLPSADQTLANYQMWRLALVELDELSKQASLLLPAAAAGQGARSFSGVETGISSTLAIIQTIGSFFVTNESVAGIVLASPRRPERDSLTPRSIMVPFASNITSMESMT